MPEATIENLIKILKEKYDHPNIELVRRAYDYAEKAHEGQSRLTGEPYIIHPTASAITLANMRLDENVLAATLLHDVPEDTQRTIEEIEKEFGADIAKMVESITKLGKLKYRGMDRYVENLRKMFLAMAEDVRVIFIKFADRLHNLQTLGAQPEKKRQRIAEEVLEIYAPIANRLGMGEFKGEFEDLAFRYIMPQEYERVTKLAAKKLKQKEKFMDVAIEKTKTEIEKNNVKIISIHGRAKHIYSLYKKLLNHDDNIDKIYDFVAIRIIVNNINDCYSTLGIIHQIWKPMTGRVKDYIAQPKPNGYRSLHTTVFSETGDAIEFQIRTLEMHEEAEFGIAGHWRYKEPGIENSKSVRWLNELATLQKDFMGRKEFLNHMEELKFDVLNDRIFVFTPKGDVIDLPSDSTPVDFAYAIHTDIGDKCSSAKVNDSMVNLNTKLKSGDMCEIVIEKNRKGPNADWLDFVKTQHARDKIRDFTKHTVKGWIREVITSNNGALKKKKKMRKKT